MIRYQIIATMLFALFCTSAVAADYNIKRVPDGPFSFSISGIKLNKGSTLQRESILFNDPSCPIILTSHKINFKYMDRGFKFNGTTVLEVKRNVRAIQVRTILYDIFGRHMKNLANTEPKDFSPGHNTITGIWRASENDISEFLTSVTYVARVRFEDGTQWVFNADNLQLALSSLKLEKKIGEDEE